MPRQDHDDLKSGPARPLEPLHSGAWAFMAGDPVEPLVRLAPSRDLVRASAVESIEPIRPRGCRVRLASGHQLLLYDFDGPQVAALLGIPVVEPKCFESGKALLAGATQGREPGRSWNPTIDAFAPAPKGQPEGDVGEAISALRGLLRMHDDRGVREVGLGILASLAERLASNPRDAKPEPPPEGWAEYREAWDGWVYGVRSIAVPDIRVWVDADGLSIGSGCGDDSQSGASSIVSHVLQEAARRQGGAR